MKKHTYILQPVTGNAKYVKSQLNEYADSHQPQQKASVNLDDVTLCLSKVCIVLYQRLAEVKGWLVISLWSLTD